MRFRSKKRNKFYLLSLSVLALVFLGLFVTKTSLFKEKHAEAAGGGVGINGNVPALDPGDVIGFAWGSSTSTPKGGVGWINFSCKTSPNPNPCSSNWGVKADLSHTVTQGRMSGYAWSNNYGWLSFQRGDVASCFANSTTIPRQVATIENLGTVNLGDPDNTRDVVGWAKFISANTDPSGGWDGCVSFTDVPRPGNQVLYRTSVDLNTGQMSGFAWGGNVTGWISFDCDGCNTTVVNNPTDNLLFWADQYTVSNPGDHRTLFWQASSGLTACNSYNNTSNYPDWKRTLGGGSQPQSITIAGGNLPAGSWQISGISQDTTYNITCSGPSGTSITKSVTIRVSNQQITACTDPAATNYTVPGPNVTSDNSLCVYNSTSPTLQLLVSSPTLIIGSGNYDEVLTWTSNVSTLHACVGSFFKSTTLGTTSHALTGWTSPSVTNLASPNVNNYTAVQSAAAGPNQFATLAGGISNAALNPHFVFKISCQDSANGNNTVWADAVVNMVEQTVSTEPPLVQLWIQDPPTTGAPNNFQSSTQIPPWNNATSSGGFNPVTLKWQELNVVPDSCVGDSEMFIGTNNSPIGSNGSWNSVSLPDQGGGYGQMDLDITTQSIVHKTKFQIKCHPLNDPTSWVSAQVCMGISGEPFPQCSAGNSLNRPPSYKEI